MTSWARRGLVASVVATVLLAGCTAEEPDWDDAPDASANRQPITAGDQYVALGDSYTSAPGVGTTTGPAGCLRTDGNYPTLLATALDLELTDVSCGGAKTDDMTRPQALGADTVPAQVDAVTGETDLVTLSIGANNGSVYGNLVVSCARLAVTNPTGAPCSDLAQKNPDVLPEVFDGVAADIVTTVGAILDRAPKARIVVVGYPQIIPAQGTCPLLPLAEGDYAFGRGVLQEFVEAQAEAAEQAGAEYVDVWDASEGHDICSNDPWVAGFRPAKAGTAYHPYAEEQAAVADLLESVVSGP